MMTTGRVNESRVPDAATLYCDKEARPLSAGDIRLGSTGKKIRPIFEACDAAGWRYKRGSRGWLFYAPDGKTTVNLHMTLSDSRGWKNKEAEFRRAGLEVKLT